MFASFGQDTLLLALLLAFVTSITGFFAYGDKTHYMLRATRLLSITVFLFISAAFITLILAYVHSDFSLVNVYQNSHTDKPLFYKIAGAWGNHEGSMLLWTWVAAFFSALLATFGLTLGPRFFARVLSIQSLLITGFLAFVYFTSNPFAEMIIPEEQGLGLNPLLQDPALALHPPMLYLGYVGTSLAFSFAVAGLFENSISRAWAAALRPWVLAAWSALTCGIALGSWWAYYELGWGGWWFWDPVENASFIPWLSATALLHTLIVVEKRGTMKNWAALLALITFTLSLIGTFLVRSGVITSVHAFALDPARGVFVLLLIGLTAGLGLLLYAIKAHTIDEESHFAPLSRETLLVLNNIFLVSAAATVLLGTLYPLILEAITGEKISVGAPYFEATFTPLMMPLVALMGLAPFMAWQKDSAARLLPSLRHTFLFSLAASGVLLFAIHDQALRFYVGLGLAFWLFVTSLMGLVRAQGKNMPMSLSHLGVAICLFGMVATSHLAAEKAVLVKQGDTLAIKDYVLTLREVVRGKGPNYLFERAIIDVSAGGKPHGVLEPERRLYPESQKLLSEVAIQSNGLSDLYLVFGNPQKDENDAVKGWSLRAAHYPLAPWIWLGCLVMACGGIAGMMQRKRSV